MTSETKVVFGKTLYLAEVELLKMHLEDVEGS